MPNVFVGEQSVEEELKQYVETCVCECPAHSNDEFFPIMSELFEITPPLNDDTGNTLASFILPFILKSAAMNNLIFDTTKLGSTGTVNYILQLPSGETSMFTDFIMLQHYSRAERRLGKDFLNIVELGGWERYNPLRDHHLMSKWPLWRQAYIQLGNLPNTKK